MYLDLGTILSPLFNYLHCAEEYIRTKATNVIHKWNMGKGLMKLWIRNYFIHRFECGSLHKEGKTFRLTYYIDSTRYCIAFPVHRGPSRVVWIENECGEDVSKDVWEKMGPCHNFHGIPTTPELLGYTRLTFHMRIGSQRVYEIREHIDTVELNNDAGRRIE